jgi:TonB-linked SusC/RagA family outer membrane protein
MSLTICFVRQQRIITKTLFIMKLTAILLTLASLTASATSYSQSQITLNEKNVPLQRVFKQIQKQSGYSFLYSYELLQRAGKVTISIQKASLEEALDACLRNKNIGYSIVGNTVVVKPKKAADPIPALNAAVEQPPIAIKGTVTDEKGKKLQGVSVTVKGTNIGTNTDENGEFDLRLADDTHKVLVFSFVGMQSQEVTVGASNVVSVSLQPAATQQQEIVIVGYQSQRRSSIAGAVTTVNVNDVSKIPTGFADQALQGQASGVRVTQATGQPGDGVAIRIRGVGSINNNDPLYIIDGVPTQDGINFLAASDIASITVLKDAASAAIYGARSSNGVVIITTKNGRSGNATINYSVYAGVQTHGYLTPMTNAAQYKTLYNEMVVNDNAGLAVGNPLIKKPIPDTIPMANTNWLGAIFRTAPEQDHEISVSGGNEKTQYVVSANAYKQDGIILNSWYDRYTLRTKLTSQVTDHLNTGFNLSFSYYGKNSIGSSGDGYGGNGGSVIRYAFFRDPAIPIYNSPGVYSDLPNYPGYFGDGYNPVGLANNTSNIEKQYRGFGNVFAELKIIPNLSFKSDFGGDIFVTEDKTFNLNWGTGGRINNPNSLVENQITSENMVWNNTFHYNAKFGGKHSLNILAGTEAVSNTTVIHSETNQSLPNQSPQLQFLGNGLFIQQVIASENEGQWALLSFLGNVNYSYKDKFLLSGTARRDGSSRFGPTNRWGNFFSGGAAWNMVNEPWFAEMFPVVSRMKLRVSYGQLGNQDIGDYPWASVVTNTGNYPFGGQAPVQGYSVSSLGNTDVKWETSTQADAGLDIAILNDRLSLSVDYFDKTNKNMLVAVPLPLIGGSANAPFINDGSVQNKGFEFDLQYRNNAHRLQYSVSANLATIQNKVLSIPVPIQGGRIDDGVYATQTTAGHPLGAFYGYQMIGIFQNQADIFKSAYQGPGIRPGDVKYKDIDGSGTIDANDRTFLGSAIPKFTYGATVTLNYLNFDLFVLAQGSYGNKIYLQVNQDIEGFYRPFNLTKRVFDERWHGEGTSNSMPLVSWLDQPNNIKEPSSRFLESAAYCRLKNIQLGYTIPKELTSKLHIKSLRFYVTGDNLVTITKYTGLDPEMHISNNVRVEKYPSDVAAGIDWGTYPSAKSYIIGANLNF